MPIGARYRRFAPKGCLNEFVATKSATGKSSSSKKGVGPNKRTAPILEPALRVPADLAVLLLAAQALSNTMTRSQSSGWKLSKRNFRHLGLFST